LANTKLFILASTTDSSTYSINIYNSNNSSIFRVGNDGTVTAPVFSGGLVGNLNATNVSSGQFGANTGGGPYSFPGNVGIGTTSPSEKLQVNGSISNPVDNSVIVAGNDANLGFVKKSGYSAEITTNNSVDIIFSKLSTATLSSANVANGSLTELMRITNAGNVGIGMTNPGAKLEVNGNVKLSGSTPTYTITNVNTPNNSSDVATKGYVDTSVASAKPNGWNCTSTQSAWSGQDNNAYAYCPATFHIVSGGCYWQAGTSSIVETQTIPDLKDNAWQCYYYTGYSLAYALCCK
jgi:hypothetical protein